MFFLSIVIFTASSCNNTSKKETSFTPEYNFRCINKNWNVSDYFDLNKIICLETNENCFISRIDKMLIKNDRIYILDIKAKSVFMFTVEGKYISKINNVGKGPDEYLSIESMDITNDAICLLAWQAKQKIMKFDLELSFINEEASLITCGAIKVVEDGVYCYPSNSCDKKLYSDSKYHNFAFLDKKRKVVWSDLPYNESFCGRSNTYGSRGCNFSLSSSSGLFFTKPFSDYIYKVEKDGLKPYIKLDFGYKSIENAQNKMDRLELLQHYNEKGLFKSIGNLCISQDFTYFQIFSDKSFRCIVEGDIAYFTTCSGVDPKVGLNMSSQVGSTSDYEGMIVEVDPIHIKYMCKNSPDKVTPAIKEIDKSLTQNDNPVLLFLKLKD
jgi:hypothetical protein